MVGFSLSWDLFFGLGFLLIYILVDVTGTDIYACQVVLTSVSDPDESGFFSDPDFKNPDPDPSVFCFNKLTGSK